ncbi:OmpA family protein [Sulfurimonas crateris]|uniref:OmpA family protein n=1 Tax=Sulfurimonas crateris TaxID=2574727 RepID=A0A4U2Z464_9BACT|nr:OmpA family protein [Sulfurimonas crateris]TKI68594.1 OmpA family protein [Sulfurimonas crateris]
MKKLLLIPALLFSSALTAQEYSYEVTPVIGYNIAEGNLDLDNQFLMGAELQYNDFDYLLKPELSLLYSHDIDYENSSLSTDIYRIALNGVYEYKTESFIKPLAKIGVGYETLNEHFAENKDSVFLNAGVGAKIPIVESISLKLEAVYMLKNNDNRWDNNLALLAGINYSFGPKIQEAPAPVSYEAVPVIAPVDGDDDNDGVLNSKDKCPNTPAGTEVDSNGCKVDGDDDNDGVLNSKDKCPTTPAGNVVDEEGCTKIVNLHINFETASYTVDKASKPNVEAFANFLKARINFDAKIIGHTDSIGSVANNQELSENRANAVKEMIVSYGVDASRITTEGMGESTPTATNDTAEGRAENRRIEAELIKK